MIALVVFEVDQLFYQGLLAVESGWNFEEASFHEYPQIGDEIAAWDEVSSMRIGVRMTDGGNGDWDQGCVEARGL